MIQCRQTFRVLEDGRVVIADFELYRIMVHEERLRRARRLSRAPSRADEEQVSETLSRR